MNKRLVALVLICVLLITATDVMAYKSNTQESEVITLDDLKERYPDARFREVNAEEFRAAQARFRENSIVVADYKEPSGKEKSGTRPGRQRPAPSHIDEGFSLCGGSGSGEETMAGRGESGDVSATIAGNINIPDIRGGGSGDVAIILFMVIGVVIVAVLVVYMGGYVYNVVTRKRSYRHWCEFGARSTFMIENNGNKGSFQSLTFGTGFIDRNTHIGIMGEAGYMHLADNRRGFNLKGLYGIIGPALRWYTPTVRNPTYFFLELLAGTSQHREMGLISTARMGFNAGMGSGWRLGFHIGSVYSNIKETEGIARQSDKFNVIYGLEAGYRF